MWFALLVVTAGCGRVAFDPLDGGDGGPPPPDGTSLACSAMPTCPGFTLPISPNGTSTGSTNPRDNGLASSCGGNASPEAAFKLDPRGDGTFTIRVTVGGPALLVLRDGCCTGPEIQCAFDAPITVTRARGAPLYVYAESLASSVTVEIVGTP